MLKVKDLSFEDLKDITGNMIKIRLASVFLFLPKLTNSIKLQNK